MHNDVITCCLQIGFFQSIRPEKWPSGLIVLQTKQLIAVKPNMTGKVTFSVGDVPGMCHRKWNETEFTTQNVTKCFVLGY